MFVKICGIQSIDGLRAVIEAKADAVGFIFYEKSRRFVPPPTAVVLGAATPPSLLRVGVFVDAPIAHVVALAATVDLDAVQLHGQESPDMCRALRSQLDAALGRPVEIIKAHRLEVGEQAQANLQAVADDLRQYPVDKLLVEAAVAGSVGGSGQPWAWELAGRLELAVPMLLAGGLTPANVGQAIAAARPYGVDVSSGVETDGVKDAAKIKAFVEAARRSGG